MPPEQQTNHGTKKVLIAALLLIILALLAYVLLRVNPTGQQVTQENVQVNAVDLNNAQTPSEKLPSGFPEIIPIEVNTVEESYSADYPDRGFTQYTVSYLSAKSRDEKRAEYDAFMTANGYVFGTEVNENPNAPIYMNGKKGNDELTVVIATKNEKTSVTLSFVDWK